MNKPAQFTQGPRIERTPGKWTVQHNNNDDTTHIVANDPHVGMDMVAEIYRVSAYEGNAALIAAAPAMYEALQHATMSYHHPSCKAQGEYAAQPERYCTCHVQKARAALAQAEGNR